MYRVEYNKSVIVSLKSFIDSYKNSFIKLIKDWWLDFEDILIQNYTSIWDKLYENIINNIEKKFCEDNILWKNVENKQEYLIIIINNFRLFIYYEENISLKERKIYKIKFNKK